MNRYQYWFFIAVAFVGGVTGGFISSKFVTKNDVAFAQGEVSQLSQKQVRAETIIAESFFLHARKETNQLDGEIPIPRAVLTTEPNGNPRLTMQDNLGNPRLSIQLDDNDGASLTMFNKGGKQRLFISEKDPNGISQAGSSISLLDDNGKVRAQFGIQPDNNGFLTLTDPGINEQNKGRSIKLNLSGRDAANLSLSGVEGNIRTALRIDSNNTCFSVNDLKGGTRAELGNTELSFGKGETLEKKSGDSLTVENRPPSSLVFYNGNGKVLWSAP